MFPRRVGYGLAYCFGAAYGFFMLRNFKFVLFFCAAAFLAGCSSPKKVVFVSGNSIHLWGDHEHVIMCDELCDMVNEASNGKVRAVHLDTQKTSDLSTLDDADAIVISTEGEKNHPFAGKTDILKKLNAKGVNIGAFHYTLMFDAPEDNAAFDELIGGHYQKGYSYNPFYDARFELDSSRPEHPALRGVKSFGYYDEWHFSIYFTKNPAQKITPLLKTKVPDKIRRRRSAPQTVRDGLGKDRLETVAWVVENPNGTRGFGIMGGHVPWTLAQKDYRKLVLNTIFWLAGVDIPEAGYDASVPTFDSLVSKITKPKRGDYQYYIKDWRDFDTAARAEK